MTQNTINFSKMHGLGNDFMVIDTLNQTFVLDSYLIKQWADRHLGVGFDQLLLITPPPSPDIDFGYRIFNADASEVQQCGNGVRCLAYYVRQRKMTQKPIIRVATATIIMTLEYEPNDHIKVNMGAPDFSLQALPFIYPQKRSVYELEIDHQLVCFGAVSMGNPHIVILVNNLDNVDIATLGARLSEHPAFPQQVNVGFMQLVSPSRIKLRVYERGIGETLACGSGACAAVVVGQLWELLGSDVEVALPGGKLMISRQSNTDPVYMMGTATFVFDGEITL